MTAMLRSGIAILFSVRIELFGMTAVNSLHTSRNSKVETEKKHTIWIYFMKIVLRVVVLVERWLRS